MDELKATFIDDNLSFDAAVDRYHKRRQVLLDQCQTICVISGVETSLEQNNFWLLCDYPLYQDPNILYYSGLNQEKVALIFNPFTKTVCLALPTYDSNKVFWEGHFLGYKESNVNKIKSLFKYDEIIDHSTLLDYLFDSLANSNSHSIATCWHEDAKKQINLEDIQYEFKTQLESSIKSNGISCSIINYFHLLNTRLTLDDTDISNAKIANTYAKFAFHTCCKHIKSCSTETEVAGLLKGEIYKRCPLGQSFPAIVANEKNATILHYKKNDAEFVDNGLLLLDFGCRVHNVVSDISRTIPTNGTFNPLQKILYTIVLNAQKQVEIHVKAGVCIDELNTHCWNYIETELNTQIIERNGTVSQPYTKQPHNVSHLIAHSVHDGDPFRLYRKQALKPGMIISNEPGLYGYFELEIDGILYKEHCGIRIEDNLLVLNNGCENLSASIVKEIVDIESLINS